MNLGVVSALVMSFVYGTFATIPQEDFYYGDLRNSLKYDQKFIQFTHEYLTQKDFNFTVLSPVWGQLSSAQYTDIEPLLLRAGNAKDGSKFYECGPEVCNSVWYEVESISFLIRDEMPASVYYSYYAMHYRDHAKHRRTLVSTAVITWGLGGCSVCTMVPLFLSVAFYVVLSILPVREECDKGDYELLLHYNKMCLPFIVLGYSVLLVGIVDFFIVLDIIASIRSPIEGPRRIFANIFMYSLMVPMACVTLLWSIYVYVKLYRQYQITYQQVSSMNESEAFSEKEKEEINKVVELSPQSSNNNTTMNLEEGAAEMQLVG